MRETVRDARRVVGPEAVGILVVDVKLAGGEELQRHATGGSGRTVWQDGVDEEVVAAGCVAAVRTR